jgi:hypothetical protein
MKIIITIPIIIALLTLSLNSFSEGIFKKKIKFPIKITNDWDSDGVINSNDPDDDNDGINDVNDRKPFGKIIKRERIIEEVYVIGFYTDKESYFKNEDVILSWEIENPRSLNLYSDVNMSVFVEDVTSKNSVVVNPVGDVTYYLDAEKSVSNVSVYEYTLVSKSCALWLPLPVIENAHLAYQQTRLCNLYYSSQEPKNTIETILETRILDPII